MDCPVCRVALVMSERQGVEIDYCPQCRGVWLDRGELDKIIDKSSSQEPSYGQPMEQPRSSSHNDTHYKKPHKKESFFSELFDF